MIAYRKIFVVFHGASMEDARWYYVFRNKAKFHHVSAFYYDAVFEHWILIEWTEHGLFYGIVTDQELDIYVATCCMAGGKILHYKAVQAQRYNMPLVGMGYCVYGAKHLTNIKSWAMTPDQLFSALQKRGARAAFTSVAEAGENEDGRNI